jgi:hypothetical protein
MSKTAGPVAVLRGLAMPLAAVNLFDAAVTVVATFYGYPYYNTFGLLCMVEAALIFILAGNTEIHETPLMAKIRSYLGRKEVVFSPKRYAEARQTATKYLVLGAIVFAEAILVSLTYFI